MVALLRNGWRHASATASRLLSGSSPPPLARSFPTSRRNAPESVVNGPPSNASTVMASSRSKVRSRKATRPMRKSIWLRLRSAANARMPFFTPSISPCMLAVTSRTNITSAWGRDGSDTWTPTVVPAVTFVPPAVASATTFTDFVADGAERAAVTVALASVAPFGTVTGSMVTPAGGFSKRTSTGPSNPSRATWTANSFRPPTNTSTSFEALTATCGPGGGAAGGLASCQSGSAKASAPSSPPTAP